VLTGLGGQMILLPLLAFALAFIFPIPAVIAIGLIILAACPGGITSNAYVLASRGDIALSVTLTTISSLLSIITMPLLTWLALTTFATGGDFVEVPITSMMIGLARLTLVPIAIGMTLRHYKPQLADSMKEPVRKLAFFFLMVVILGNTWFSIDTIKLYFVQAGAMVIVLNLCCMGMGYGLSKLTRLNTEQTITITYEVGIQNLSLALTLANTILLMPDYAIFAIIYGFLMKFSALGFMAFARRMHRLSSASQATDQKAA
jgi:BASS family bile acid:Na+ symporter